jgi:hypothetical protein
MTLSTNPSFLKKEREKNNASSNPTKWGVCIQVETKTNHVLPFGILTHQAFAHLKKHKNIKIKIKKKLNQGSLF